VLVTSVGSEFSYSASLICNWLIRSLHKSLVSYNLTLVQCLVQLDWVLGLINRVNLNRGVCTSQRYQRVNRVEIENYIFLLVTSKTLPEGTGFVSIRRARRTIRDPWKYSGANRWYVSTILHNRAALHHYLLGPLEPNINQKLFRFDPSWKDAPTDMVDFWTNTTVQLSTLTIFHSVPNCRRTF
jgi:hypothetical protein